MMGTLERDEGGAATPVPGAPAVGEPEQPPGSPTDRQALMAGIGAAARAQQRSVDVFDESVVNHLGLNRTDGRCVDIIAEQGPISAGELARQARLTTGAVTTVIDRLEHAGWVRRLGDPDDRRRVLVEVTEQTLEAVGAIYTPLVIDGMRELDGFTDAQLAVILEFLTIDRSLHERHAELVGKWPPRRAPGP
jgi:DNA-binding MarR family transcriptional regulator